MFTPKDGKLIEERFNKVDKFCDDIWNIIIEFEDFCKIQNGRNREMIMELLIKYKMLKSVTPNSNQKDEENKNATLRIYVPCLTDDSFSMFKIENYNNPKKVNLTNQVLNNFIGTLIDELSKLIDQLLFECKVRENQLNDIKKKSI